MSRLQCQSGWMCQPHVVWGVVPVVEEAPAGMCGHRRGERENRKSTRASTYGAINLFCSTAVAALVLVVIDGMGFLRAMQFSFSRGTVRGTSLIELPPESCCLLVLVTSTCDADTLLQIKPLHASSITLKPNVHYVIILPEFRPSSLEPELSIAVKMDSEPVTARFCIPISGCRSLDTHAKQAAHLRPSERLSVSKNGRYENQI